MINYNKNELINQCLVTYYETFAHTLDTADYVPEKYNKKIMKYIFKNMKRQFRKLDKDDKQYQRQFNKKANVKLRQAKVDLKAQIALEQSRRNAQKPLIRFKSKQEKIALRKQVKALLRQAKAAAKKSDKEVTDNGKT